MLPTQGNELCNIAYDLNSTAISKYVTEDDGCTVETSLEN